MANAGLHKKPVKETTFDSVKDSNQHELYEITGAKRDTRKGKGRFDLISPIALKRLAVHYENGAVKYSDRNWEKGMPLGRLLDSALRHLVQCMECKHDEDHAIAVAWNMFAFVHIAELIKQGKLPKELDDIGWWKEEPDYATTNS